jgi:anti-anti-sigma factor
MAEGFSASVRRHDGVAVIDLLGDIDGSSHEAILGAYQAAAAGGEHRILLNFGQATYINSTGIAVIVGLARARAEGRTVLAAGLSAHYREIFEITRLSDFMTIYPDEASAVA